MRLHRPVLLALALGTVLPVTAASAASGVAAAGSAVSSATIATVTVGSLDLGATTIPGHSVSLGSLTAVAQTLTSAAPSVSFVPVSLDGAETGAVTVTPDNSPKTVAPVSTAALPLDIVSASGPSATLTAAKAATGPVASVTSSLGQVEILGLPITLNGGLEVGSVTDGKHAQAGKTLKITNVSLPNLADLLAALGIDIAKLPVETLSKLVTELNMALSSATETAFNAADDAAKDAVAAVAAASTAANDANNDLDDATEALDTALSGATLPLGVEGPLDSADWDALGATPEGVLVQEAVTTANSGVATAAAAYEDAKDAVADAAAAAAAAVAALPAAVAALAGIVESILAGTPLAKIGDAEVGTKAAVGSTKVANVTGYVSGVEVLGTDVVKTVTGDSKIDAAKMLGGVANDVNAAIATATGALSNVLSSATGAAGLVVPAPSIKVLSKETSTGSEGAFGTANATVSALSITMGSVSVPATYALSDAANLPGVGALGTGFKTAPLAVNVGTLAEAAKYRAASNVATPAKPNTPAKPGTPGANPTHPATGGPAALAIIAMVGVAVAFGVRRHLRTDG